MVYSCKYVFKKLRKLSSHSSELLSHSCRSGEICVYSTPENACSFPKYEKELTAIIEQLIKDGYLAHGPYPETFYLTHLGLHKVGYTVEAIKRFLFNSFVVPAVVAFITTVITLVTTNWLSLM